jgi:iron(III) transport system permease protein
VTTGVTALPGLKPEDTDPRSPKGGRGFRVFAWRLPDRWFVIAALVALVTAIPVITVLLMALTPTADIWAHLSSTVLPTYVANTLILFAGVGTGTILIGVSTAWLVTMCRFPGDRIFDWALLLPLAVPSYILAFVATDMLEFSGPVQGALREIFGWKTVRDYWFPDIRTIGGAITMFSLTLYPYVYLLARSAFLQQSVCVLEVSRTLGRSSTQSFFQVALPLARPAIVAGVALALMETLNDYGTVHYFAVNTFATGIYDVWMSYNNSGGAAQLASVLLGFVILLIALENLSRRQQRFHQTTGKVRDLPGYRLTGWKRTAAIVICFLPVGLGFILPAAVLALYAFESYAETFSARFLTDMQNSFVMAAIAAVIAVGIGILLSYANRLRGGKTLTILTRLAVVGYAVPGSVLALGIIIPFGWLDNRVDAFMREHFDMSTGLLLSGTMTALIFAYVVRFLAVSFGAATSGLAKVTRNMDNAARMLGRNPAGTLVDVHVPLIRASLVTAGLLVFVDVMKELSMTLILRPFNFNTLATRAYDYASDERLWEASLPALSIVIVGIVPVILMSRILRQSRPGR